jgi:hypothetical protein
MSPSTDTRDYRESACELKFLVGLATSEHVRDWARTKLQPDPNADGTEGDAYRITSLYLDTDQFDVFHRRGSFGRSKYRIRRYGSGDVAFLERKLKTKGVLAKRRSRLSLDQLGNLQSTTPVPDPDAFWFHRRLLARGLRPICQISYRRTARFALSNLGPIRLTLDDDLCALPAPRLAFQDCTEALPILTDQRVLELKFRGDLPALFKELLHQFSLAPSSFSKYRHAARKLGCVPHPDPEPAPAPTSHGGQPPHAVPPAVRT